MLMFKTYAIHGNILWTIVNLLVLYAIFRKFLFQPAMKLSFVREDMIYKQFDDPKTAGR